MFYSMHHTLCNDKETFAKSKENPIQVGCLPLILVNPMVAPSSDQCRETAFITKCLLYSKIIPLVKNKCGKLSDKNNYRPVAISNSLSKVFELLLLDRCEEYLWTSGNQFGFKADHSTEMCIYALHEFIYYYRSRSTNVYVTFLDASKAFDRINHWLLFDKLLKREIPLYIVRILVYW